MQPTTATTGATHALSLSAWLMAAWLISSTVAIAISLSIWFVLSVAAEVALIGISAAIGIGIVVSRQTDVAVRRKLLALPLVKRYLILIVAPVAFAVLSFGNVYLALFATHLAIARPSTATFTVSSKGESIDLPWRCERYVLFAEIRFVYLKKACLSAEQFERIHRGSVLTILGSESPLGFRAIEFSGEAS